jgi:hypothetical protein
MPFLSWTRTNGQRHYTIYTELLQSVSHRTVLKYTIQSGKENKFQSVPCLERSGDPVFKKLRFGD